MQIPREESDRGLDQQLKSVLQPTLSHDADQRIRGRLQELPVPGNIPIWLLQPNSGVAQRNVLSGEAWRQTWSSAAAAAVVFVLSGIVLFALAGRGNRTDKAGSEITTNVTRISPHTDEKSEVARDTERQQDGPATLGKDFESPLLKKPRPH